MTSQPFDIRTVVDLFRVFHEAVEDYLADQLSSRKALICALFAWHLADWVYAEYPPGQSFDGFKEQLKVACPSLSHMQDIANGTKHRSITRYTPTVRASEKHQGAFSNDFSKDFDISSLRLTLDDDSVVYFDEEVIKARDYWRSYFADLLGLSTEIG